MATMCVRNQVDLGRECERLNVDVFVGVAGRWCVSVSECVCCWRAVWVCGGREGRREGRMGG